MIGKYKNFVMTAGVSIFGPHNLFASLAKACNSPVYFDENTRGFRLTNGIDERQAYIQWQEQCKQWAQEMTISDGSRVSAEYSLLAELRDQKRLEEGLAISLIHSETLDGTLAAILLKEILKEQFHNATVTLKPIEKLDASKVNNLSEGLGSFMGVIAEELGRFNREKTCFAPLGGYKFMVMTGYLVGASMGYPALYLHETDQRLYEIPPLAIRIDETTLERLSTLLNKLDEQPHLYTNLETKEQDILRENTHLFHWDKNGEVRPNAFGRYWLNQRER